MTLSDGLYLVDKPVGATPLESLHALRAARPELVGRKLAYAGRLDPMASGLLPVIGEPLLMRQEEFWNLTKEYEAVVVLGISTDSSDLLGLAHAGSVPIVPSARIMAAVSGLVGKTNLAVPAFSSYRMRGVEPPVRRMAVHEASVCDIGVVRTAEIARAVAERVPLVRGDFRQEAILAGWNGALAGRAGEDWPLARLRIQCGAGTYIRSLVPEIGRQLRTGAFLFGLRRTKVADWSVDGPRVIRFSWPQ
jgi:tRNA pseudouridine55 synthase